MISRPVKLVKAEVKDRTKLDLEGGGREWIKGVVEGASGNGISLGERMKKEREREREKREKMWVARGSPEKTAEKN